MAPYLFNIFWAAIIFSPTVEMLTEAIDIALIYISMSALEANYRK